MCRLWPVRRGNIMLADVRTTTALPGSWFELPMNAVAGLRRVCEMIDTVSTMVEVSLAALSFGVVVMLARARWLKTRRPEKQPVPILVERDSHER